MLKEGAVVLSLSGRDKGKLLAVVGNEQNRVLVCDGKERPVERPKRKNMCHLEEQGTVLGAEEIATNKALKKALRRLNPSLNGKT